MPIETIKVLHVIARYNIGGTPKYLSQLIPDLISEGVEVVLVVGRVQLGEVEDSSLERLPFERVENLGRRINLIEDFKSYFKLRRIVKSFNPDIIHSHTFKAGLLSRVMFFRIPKVHTYHGHLLTDPEFSRFQIFVIIFIERLLGLLTREFITTGKQVSSDLLSTGIGNVDRFTSVPGELNPIELIPRDQARTGLGLDSQFTILWVARFAPVKNPSLLIEVAELLPDCQFLMAGDGIEMERIRELAGANIKILGIVETRRILMAGDIFLSTSLNEGIPYTFLEAQYAGLPIVAVDAGAVSEIVSHGEDGLLVGPDASEIARVISEFRSQPRLREKMSKKAREKSVKRGNTIGIAHLNVYTRILRD